ncbi:hypothetical protein [Vibrio caribbeanicus]|uniref:hypothetical protein n=1 Tax=Vibrio caribbeanicus TaxID=701175 RepID=UPI0022850EC8|nr:hypothetical protein [Vibrio caribbeanicus]MCY9844571.1 hypothetical protein [Vibrio caribbeanicus]
MIARKDMPKSIFSRWLTDKKPNYQEALIGSGEPIGNREKNLIVLIKANPRFGGYSRKRKGQH